jgi:hypothetical protein
MAQYIFVSASSFGNGHSSDTTYSFSVGTGTIFLSGSGGYVNNPTGITKATLDDPGVYLELSDESLTYVTCSVDTGFTCANTIKYVSWTPPVTPTPTPTGTYSVATLSLQAVQELGTYPTYNVQVAINGYKTFSSTLVQTTSAQVTDTTVLIKTGTPNGTGTITVTRVDPDNTVTDLTSITVGGVGFTSTPSLRSYSSGDTVGAVTFSITGFTDGEDFTVDIAEG